MQFALDISRFAERAKDKMNLVVRKVAIDLFSRVILRTPVGNPSLWKNKPPKGYVGGRLRANWQCAIGNVPSGTLQLNDKTGQATINRMQAVALGLKAGETITLVNNLPYARPVEFGWSKQAPAGMVGITVQEFNDAFNKALS